MSSMAGNVGFGPTGPKVGRHPTGGYIIPRGYERGQLGQFSPEQMQLFQQLFSHVGPDSFLSRLASGDQSQFEQLEAPAHRQFQGQLGQLASRFSGMGMGGRRSSGFQNTATAAASNFSQDLASRRLGLQQQAISELMGLGNQLLGQRPYEQFLTEKPQSFLKSLLSGLAPGLSQGFGSALGSRLFSGSPSSNSSTDSSQFSPEEVSFIKQLMRG